MGIEMHPLRRSRTTSSLELQTKESQRIDQNLKDDLKSAKREVKVVILGAKSRKRFFEEMRLSDGQPQCYTTEQLRLFLSGKEALGQRGHQRRCHTGVLGRRVDMRQTRLGSRQWF
ncbi:hypothetical protein LB505_007853 [Fusarium chuoi]|nr:hypothetical protein LB505_007853 [Fusarium chuoi]